MTFHRRTFLSATALMALMPSAFAAPAITANADLAAWFEAKFQEALKRSPQLQTALGLKTDADKWDDPSEAAATDAFAAETSAVAELRAKFAKQSLSLGDQLSYRLFENRYARRAKAFAFRDNDYIFDQMNGAQAQLPAFLINLHKVTNVTDVQNYIARLNGLAPLMAALIKESDKRAASGVMPPKWVYPFVISDARNIINGAPFNAGVDSALFADIKTKIAALNLPDAQAQVLVSDASNALLNSMKPAYMALIHAMEVQEKNAPAMDGVWRFKNGAAYYRERLGFHTTTTMTAREIHQLGLDNVKRIHSEMITIMNRVNFKGNLQSFFNFMRTDQQFYYPNTSEGKAAYLAEATRLIDVMRTKIPNFFGTLPKASLSVKAVEAFREKSAGKAFYQRPAPDGSRPGVYYANLYNMADMPKYEMEALAYHEGIPGHHLQGSITTELKSVPKFRAFGGYTAYSEGWGLYCEWLPKEMGAYIDVYADFGRLGMELWRAARLVVDTGIHDKRWSREKAVQYLKENTPNSDGDIQKAIERYVVYPGQATAYAIGMLKIRSLRAMAENKLGAKFDLRAFHDAILLSGAVPLDILQENIEAWVQQRALA
jgi:uncharacterized protein (DUF885 family)